MGSSDEELPHSEDFEGTSNEGKECDGDHSSQKFNNNINNISQCDNFDCNLSGEMKSVDEDGGEFP